MTKPENAVAAIEEALIKLHKRANEDYRVPASFCIEIGAIALAAKALRNDRPQSLQPDVAILIATLEGIAEQQTNKEQHVECTSSFENGEDSAVKLFRNLAQKALAAFRAKQTTTSGE